VSLAGRLCGENGVLMMVGGGVGGWQVGLVRFIEQAVSVLWKKAVF